MKKLTVIFMSLALAAAMLTSCAGREDNASLSAPSDGQAGTASSVSETEAAVSEQTVSSQPFSETESTTQPVSEAGNTSQPVSETGNTSQTVSETGASVTEQAVTSQTVSETEAAAQKTEEISQSRLYAEYGSQIEEIKSEAYFHGDCGSKLEWYYMDGVLLITGDGEMSGNYLTDEFEYTAPWVKDVRFSLAEEIELVIIDEGVTSICSGAFYCLESLKEAVLSDTVERIGQSAFAECSEMERIDLPRSLKSIGDDAFFYCSALTSIVIPDSVEEIGMRAFTFCSEADITLPNWLTNVNLNDISYMTKSVTIPASVTEIEEFGYHQKITFLGDAPEIPVCELYSEFDEVVGIAISGLEAGYETDYADSVYTDERIETGVTIYYSGEGFEKYIEMFPQYEWVKK